MRIRITKDLPPTSVNELPGPRKNDQFEAFKEGASVYVMYQGEKCLLLKHEYEVIEEEKPKTEQRVVTMGDKQQYPAQPHEWDPERGVTPIVRLISITPDPLGKLAFLNGTYKGIFYDSQEDPRITEQDKMQALIDMQQTHLQAPLEAIKIHVRIDGVDRAFTHQLVRYRMAMYAQESLRFSVVGDLEHNVTLPPSLFGTEPMSDYVPRDIDPTKHSLAELEESTAYEMATKEQRWRMQHDYAIRIIDAVYTRQIETGMPAEEARGLLPTEVATRINWLTDLRNMKEGAGQRLCTQAQFHWRAVWLQIVQRIREYSDGNPANDWQYQAIADSSFFRPICYQLGRCPMKAEFDRACTIRGRVDAYEKSGIPSSRWHQQPPPGDTVINPAEWMADPSAARL